MPWLSFHLFLQDGFDEFLISALPPFLAAESERGSFVRFFFIRYSEGGNHLRLRFLAPQESCGLEERLARCVAAGAGAGFRPRARPLRPDRALFWRDPASGYASCSTRRTSLLALGGSSLPMRASRASGVGWSWLRPTALWIEKLATAEAGPAGLAGRVPGIRPACRRGDPWAGGRPGPGRG